MAKDGSMRGGQRPNAGDHKRDAATKIVEGKKARVIPIHPAMQEGGTDIPSTDIKAPDNLVGNDMPPIDEWITEKQEDGEGGIVTETKAEVERQDTGRLQV